MAVVIKLFQPQQAKLMRLLHMEYSSRELSEELNCDARLLHRACEAGCPHRVDSKGRLWIIGDEFRAWYLTQHKPRQKALAENEAWCLRCRKAVPLVGELKTQAILREIEQVAGICPICGAKISRLRRKNAALFRGLDQPA